MALVQRKQPRQVSDYDVQETPRQEGKDGGEPQLILVPVLKSTSEMHLRRKKRK